MIKRGNHLHCPSSSNKTTSKKRLPSVGSLRLTAALEKRPVRLRPSPKGDKQLKHVFSEMISDITQEKQGNIRKLCALYLC